MTATPLFVCAAVQTTGSLALAGRTAHDAFQVCLGSGGFCLLAGRVPRGDLVRRSYGFSGSSDFKNIHLLLCTWSKCLFVCEPCAFISKDGVLF